MRAWLMAYAREVGTLAYTAWTAPPEIAWDAFCALLGHALWWAVIWYFGRKLWKWFTK